MKYFSELIKVDAGSAKGALKLRRKGKDSGLFTLETQALPGPCQDATPDRG